MVASGGLALKNDDSLSNANSFFFLALKADCLRSWASRTSQKSSEGSTGKGKKKKQCNQREEDTGQDREKHSCCPVHHTPNCFNRTCAACCLYVVCPHRHNGMNNYLWCGTCDYQIQSPMSLAFGFGMLLPCFQLYNESWTALSEVAISKIKFTR